MFYIISGPSGSGKTTLIRELLSNDEDGRYGVCVSHTTRPMRENEKDGVDYHFVTQEVFTDMIEKNKLIEWVEFSGNYYGLSHAAIAKAQADDKNKAYFIDLEVQGVQRFKEVAKENNWLATYIFVFAPTKFRTCKRLGRRESCEDVVQERIMTADAALQYAGKEGSYDIYLMNDYLHVAVLQLKRLTMERKGLFDRANFRQYIEDNWLSASGTQYVFHE